MIARTNVKLNLGLNVLRRRPDGYHDLETLFIPYPGMGDTLEIIAGDDFSRTSASLFARYAPEQVRQAVSEDARVMVTLARKEGVDWDPLSDLTVRAYRLLAEDYPLGPVKIFLEKTTPVGAGLGGGSADGAAALQLLSALFGLGLSREQLLPYAARLGSDCAFFLYDTPMLGSGRGEILEPFSLDLDGYRTEVVIPEGISVSTAEAYRGIVPSLPPKPLREVLAQDVSTWRAELRNDFESTVFAAHPALEGVKAELYRRGAVYASMSGSGSAFFGLFVRQGSGSASLFAGT